MEGKERPVPLFLARQPILRQADWQHMLQTGTAGDRAATLAKEGNSQAGLHWGRMLLNGQGTKQDEATALAWFQKVAAQDQGKEGAAALNMLGRAYQNGWGGAVDFARAFAYYVRAARRGDIWALFNLADCYRQGKGCITDKARAAQLYQQAADKGHVKALNMLGLCYEEGSGVTQNVERAVQLFAQGAQAGDCWACLNHARFLAAKGERAQSLAWLERSLEHGCGDYYQTFIAIFSSTGNGELRALVEKAKKRRLA